MKRPVTQPATAREQLASKPVRRPDVVCTDTETGARLAVPVRPSRWTRWLLRVPQLSVKQFELDALGKFVWEQCDGRTSVRRIARRLQQAHNISGRDAQVATTAFLQTLATKGLIAVKRKANERPNPVDAHKTDR